MFAASARPSVSSVFDCVTVQPIRNPLWPKSLLVLQTTCMRDLSTPISSRFIDKTETKGSGFGRSGLEKIDSA